MSERGANASVSKDHADRDVPAPDDETGQRIQLWKPGAEDTSRWLYDLVFSTFSDVGFRLELDSETTAEPSGGDQGLEQSTPSVSDSADLSNSNAATLLGRQPHLQPILQKPAPSSSVVNELLAEWTTLTEDEIQEPTPEPIQSQKKKKRSDLKGEDAQERTHPPQGLCRPEISNTFPDGEDLTG